MKNKRIILLLISAIGLITSGQLYSQDLSVSDKTDFDISNVWIEENYINNFNDNFVISEMENGLLYFDEKNHENIYFIEESSLFGCMYYKIKMCDKINSNTYSISIDSSFNDWKFPFHGNNEKMIIEYKENQICIISDVDTIRYINVSVLYDKDSFDTIKVEEEEIVSRINSQLLKNILADNSYNLTEYIGDSNDNTLFYKSKSLCITDIHINIEDFAFFKNDNFQNPINATSVADTSGINKDLFCLNSYYILENKKINKYWVVEKKNNRLLLYRACFIDFNEIDNNAILNCNPDVLDYTAYPAMQLITSFIIEGW